MTPLRRIKACLKSNRGFSLLELLIGMLILSIIVGPLLQSFFTAAQTAQKSRRMGDATLVAQNLIETVQATGLDALVADVKTGPGTLLGGTGAAFYTYDGADYALVQAADLDSVTAADETLYVGVTGLHASAYGFDAMVRIDAAAFGINTLEVTSFTPMGRGVQPATGAVRDPDLLAASDLANQAALLTGVPYTASDFCNGMKRTITIRVRENGGIVTASALYEYSAKVRYTPLRGGCAADLRGDALRVVYLRLLPRERDGQFRGLFFLLSELF